MGGGAARRARHGVVWPCGVEVARALADEPRSAHSATAMKATISVLATLGHLTARSQRTGALANGHRTSDARHTTSIMVRIVAPLMCCYWCIFGERCFKQRGLGSRHYPPTLCLD